MSDGMTECKRREIGEKAKRETILRKKIIEVIDENKWLWAELILKEIVDA